MVRTVHPAIVIDAEIPAEWEALIASFRRALHAENRATATITLYSRIVGEFARFLVWQGLPTAPTEIARVHVQQYMAFVVDSLKSSTAGVRYAALHVFFGWLMDEDEIVAHPMRKMRKPSHEPEPTGALSEEAIRALLAACAGKSYEQRRDTAIIRLLLDTGMRRAELVGIRISELDLQEQEVRVLGKGRRPRIVGFGAKATRALDSYLRVRARHPYAASEFLFLGKRGAWGPDGLEYMLSQRAAAAGVTDLYPHLFRHTFADQSIARGKSESYVMEQGGWRSESIMRHYGAGNRARRARKSFKEDSIGDAF